MVKVKSLLLGLVLVPLFLSACGQDEEGQWDVPDLVDVDIQVEEHIPAHSETELRAYVSQGEEDVDNADEVVFEVWRNQERENGDLIEGTLDANGVYTIPYSFGDDGIYIVQTHVTARDLHVMPTQTVIVGDVPEDEVEAFHNAGHSNTDDEESQFEHGENE
ncbi:FixH family protein [Shouchella sp. 1P09AA]|uniref:FixH family protein n=1 Tax=unclassified Shouchella TaxID=2893065 RepID=UPI00399FECEC